MALVTILWRKITLNNAVHRVALMRTIIEGIAEFKAKIKEIEAEIEKRIREQTLPERWASLRDLPTK